MVPVSTGGPKLTHCNPGCVDETLVEMVQCCPGLFLRLEADEAKLTELAVFGELQAAVRQGAKGSEQLPETLLLHLRQKGRGEGGAGEPPEPTGQNRAGNPRPQDSPRASSDKAGAGRSAVRPGSSSDTG